MVESEIWSTTFRDEFFLYDVGLRDHTQPLSPVPAHQLHCMQLTLDGSKAPLGEYTFVD